jgi:PKD repeat protein
MKINTLRQLLYSLLALILFSTCSLEKVEDPGGNCANPPFSAFTPDKLSGNAPLIVVFDNNSTGANSYHWIFSAGATSTLPEPTHTFTAAGTYSVSLIATAANGCKDTSVVNITVNPAGPVPVASFTITNGGCIAPCQVVFTNTSTDATSFEWDFGDGSPVATTGNPTHTFELPGDYLVKLTAIGTGGTDTETKTVLVKTQTFIATFGGTNTDVGYSVQQTADGGYVLLGFTKSEGAGQEDVYLIKTDKAGNIVWKKTFGEEYYEGGQSVQQTADGGYILCGYTNSEGAGSSDIYLIKTDNLGNQLWKKTFGGTSTDAGYSVKQTVDGGYILLGYTISEGAGSLDVYLIKTDNFGNLVWKKTFGGTESDFGASVQQTSDGGYILLGYTASEGAGQDDVYLIKTDNLGNMVWKKIFGGTGNDSGLSVQQTSDSGYILLGNTHSEGAGSSDFYLIKTDNAGNLIWKKTLGGANSEFGSSVQQTVDGGYILLGDTASEGAGGNDAYLIKTDNLGNQLWKKTFGGTSTDAGYSVKQTADGGYILLGTTSSFGAGGSDLYLIKTDKDGNAQ